MAKKSRTEYAMLNMLTGIGGYAVNTILGFICRIVFIRCLSQEYLGISGLFTNILSMLSLAELGIGSAIVYALYKPLAEDDEEKIASLVKFYKYAYIVIGIIIGIIGIAIIPFLKSIIGEYTFKENIYLIYSLYLFNTVFSYFFTYRSSLLQADQKQYVVTGTNYIITILQSIFQMAFLLITHEYISYLIIQTIGGIFYCFAISYIASKQYPYIDKEGIKPLSKNEIKSISKNVWYLLTAKLSNTLLSSTDNIITSYFNGIITVGITSNYTLFSSTISALIRQIFNGITGGIGNFSVLKNNDEKIDLFYSLHFANNWFYSLGAIGFTICGSDFVRFFYGNDYVMSISIPFAIGLTFYIEGLMNTSWNFKSALGLFKYARYVVLLTGIINIILSIALGKIWGVFGILFATSIARILTNFWYEPYCIFNYGFKISSNKYFLKTIKYIIVYFLILLINYTVCNIVNLDVLGNVISHFFICLVITNLVLYIIFRNTHEFLFMKLKIIQVKNLILNKLIRHQNIV